MIGSISCVRWNPTGQMLVSASDDKTVKLWDLTKGQPFYIAKTPDGSKLLI